MIKSLSNKARFNLRKLKAFLNLFRFHVHRRTIEEIVDKALEFGARKEFEVKTMQVRDEILALARTVAELQPRVVLEIGTAFGGTLFIWSQLASDLVISCDITDKSAQRSFYRKFPRFGSRCEVDLLTGDTHNAEFRKQVIARLKGRQVDFLFIDGDHTDTGVTADYRDYRDLVRPGGIIAFHDIVEKQSLPQNQVYHLWKNLRDQPGTKEFIKDPDQSGFGIGIIRLPER
ncbi:MAG TPA: class I SAM-dependent methyltransferase [Nitrospirota bacterium]|nr:class I SAM-dependent methyltransferase [Nitrospirota bacterium]